MAAVEFHLPDIGEGLAEVELVRWLDEYTGGDDPLLSAVKEVSPPAEGGGGHGEEGLLEVEE